MDCGYKQVTVCVSPHVPRSAHTHVVHAWRWQTWLAEHLHGTDVTCRAVCESVCALCCAAATARAPRVRQTIVCQSMPWRGMAYAALRWSGAVWHVRCVCVSRVACVSVVRHLWKLDMEAGGWYVLETCPRSALSLNR